MPGHLKALIVILVLAFAVFALARQAACTAMTPADYVRRRNLWLGLTLSAFLAPNFWAYAFVAGLLIVHAAARETNKAALFFLTLMILPVSAAQVPGLGLINYFFSLHHVRLLELLLLFPAFMKLLHRDDTTPFGRLAADRMLGAYLLLVAVLEFRETTLTDTFRHGFYLFVDVFLPYFVISRSLRNLDDFREALWGFVLAALLLAAVAVFEAARHWHLYRGAVLALGLELDSLSYIERGGILRAMGAAGHPIAAGYALAVGIGFYLFLRPSLAASPGRKAIPLLLLAGLAAPLSRGPWLGTAMLAAVFIVTGRLAFQRLLMFVMAGVVAILALHVLPGGQRVLDLLPFVGNVEKGTIDYRGQLLENTYAVITRNPWFGSVDFALAPEMQAMIQGQGIIDVVNTYLLVALRTGLVGLALFAGFFALVAWGLFTVVRHLPDREGELHALGRTLLATLLAALAIIFTVSDVGIIPVVLWSLAGLGVAYIRMAGDRTASGMREAGAPG